MDIEIYQAIKEKDGIITAYLHFKDDLTGKKLKSVCIQARTQQEFEIKINEKKIKIEQEQALKNSEFDKIVKAIETVKKGVK